MAYDFPNTPSIGQTANGYVWDGEKWQTLGSPSAPVMRTDALGWSGMQINGSFDVRQEFGNTGKTDLNNYICDGWKPIKDGTMSITSQAVDAPGYFFGFQRLLHMITSTAQPSLGATNYFLARHFIEGYRVSRLEWGSAGALPITIAFWSSHNRTGIHSVAVHNSDFSRSYVAAYTQNVGGTPQYNVITVPGDTTGTWTKDNTAGMIIDFTAASGTTYIAPAANVWGPTVYLAAPGQVNGATATSDVFRITGVVVLPGIEAPTAAQSPLIMRPFDQELVTCQRYWQKPFAGDFIIVVNAYAANARCDAVYLLPTEMRAQPTVTISGISYNNSSLLTLNGSTPRMIGFYHQSVTSGLSYTGASVALDARL